MLFRSWLYCVTMEEEIKNVKSAMSAPKQNVYSSFLMKKDGKLVFKNKAHKLMFEKFVESLQEGQDIEIFYSAQERLATAGKLAKTNIWIRELAKEVGTDPEDIKKECKRKAGFCNKVGCKSLGDMSDGELSTIMNILQEMAAFVGVILK